MKTNARFILGLSASVLLAAGCSSLPSSEELDTQATAMMKASFREQGIATMDRLDQDATQAACSREKPPADAEARRIEDAALAAIPWPAAGNYLGDWREGEKLAQNGRGMTWTDASAATKSNGGNCYNCHQIDKKEISFGTIGPSLWNYGKLRGVTDPNAPAAQDTLKYTWGKLWNAKAYAACSNMPRFGQHKLLDEEQLKHLMALLLDPKSPVNQ